MGAPSNPAMRFPGCPTCGRDVTRTVLHTGIRAAPPGGRDDQAEAFTGHAPAGWTVVAGAPDHDLLVLDPCGHHLEGHAVHAYNLAAINMTCPDLVVEVRVVVPASLNAPERRWPRILTKTGTYDAADIRRDRDPAATVARHIRTAAEAVIASLATADELAA